MSSAKIVGIHGGGTIAESIRAERINARPLPAPLIKLRDSMKLKTKNLLRKLFESADDSLFAMADKAGTNGDQAMYLDAMRELRLQRRQIATEVVKGVIQSFNELGSYPLELNPNVSQVDQEGDLEELSLIKNDDLELKVAIDGMVNRVRNAAGSALNDLQTRIEFLVSPIELTKEQMPAGPEILCECFATGCMSLEVGIKARLIVFKLFEKYVLTAMAKVYTSANQLLIQRGVLPDLKKNLGRSPQRSSTRPAHSRASAQFPVSDDIPILQPIDLRAYGGQLENLQYLINPNTQQAQTGGCAEATSSGDFHTQMDLVSALSLYQKQHLRHLDEQIACNVIDFRKLLNQSLTQGKKSADYSQLDSDVINLVAMLFEFILDDRQLQPTMKALISRLQIPILKVAIMDRTFFNRGGHPARKLLNEMASAAIGWNEKKEGKRDLLKEKIESVVETILTEFDQDIALFTRLLDDFSSFTDVELRRGLLVEQRTKDSERGKGESDLAKQTVQDVLNKSMKGKKVPECVVELLRDGWSRLMVLQFLRDGESSTCWEKSSRLVDDLIWTVCPVREGSETGSKLLHMIPGVLKSLRDGLQLAGFDEFRTSALLKELEDEQVSAIQGFQQQDSNPVLDSPSNSPSNKETSDLSEENNEQADDAVAELIRETQEIEAEYNHHQQQSSSTHENSPEASADIDKLQPSEAVACESQADENEEIILAAVEKPISETVIDESDPFVQQVDKLSMGCWFEFQNEDKPERCKLAAVIKATGKYIFVNRSGVKVAEKTRMGLAVELRRGSVQILSDGLLFDRALESVISNLQGQNKRS